MQMRDRIVMNTLMFNLEIENVVEDLRIVRGIAYFVGEASIQLGQSH